jgi:putative flippase GtrA
VGPASEQPRLATFAKKESKRVVRFIVVGALAFVVDTGSLSLFALGLGLEHRIAKGLAFALAVAASFVGNHFWTYRDLRHDAMLRQVLSFVLVSLVGLGVNLLVFSLVEQLCKTLLSDVLALYAAQAAAVGAGMVWNFAANRYFTYADPRSAGQRDSST